MILPKVEEKESLEKEFKWVVEGLLLPLVCLVGVLGNINISLWIKRKREWKIKTQLLKHFSFRAIIFGIRFTFMQWQNMAFPLIDHLDCSYHQIPNNKTEGKFSKWS